MPGEVGFPNCEDPTWATVLALMSRHQTVLWDSGHHFGGTWKSRVPKTLDLLITDLCCKVKGKGS